jgi:RNA polymerase sigma-70 factor (ECF subfamily)
MSAADEPALVEQARRDPQAFAELYDRYVDRIYAYAFRWCGEAALAQDVTSATFEKALAHLRRTGWRGASYCAWLYRIARNELIQHHRRQRNLVPLAAAQAGEANIEAAFQNKQERHRLFTALGQLSAADQEVLALRFFEELSSAEVAEILGCSTANVYLRLHRALERLRKEMNGGDSIFSDELAGEKDHV